jgi:hypothetical protein
MKKLFFLLAVMGCFTANAQNWNKVNGRWEYQFLRSDSALRIPLIKKSTADNGSIAAIGDTIYFKNSAGVWGPYGKATQLTDSSFLIGVDTILIRGTGVSIDTTSLSNRIDQKLNISDTANKWINDIRRLPGSLNVEKLKNGAWTTAYTDSVGGGLQNLQQTFDQGTTLTKHNKINNTGNRLVTTGQVINNNDTTTSGWIGSQLIYGTSIEKGITAGGATLITHWGQQTAGALGLYNDNRAISGTTLKHVSNGDNCMQDLLPTIPQWTPSIKYIVIGTYPVNDVMHIDSATYRSALSAMIDSLNLNRGYPLSSILVLNGTPAPGRGANLPLLAAAALHTAMEKGTRYFDSYNYLLSDPSNISSDNLHPSIKGQYNLANGLLNAVTTYDSVNYTRANNIQAEQAMSVNGKAYMYSGYTSTGNDSTTGNQAIVGNLSLYGNFVRAATFKSGVTLEKSLSVIGDGSIGKEWNLFYDPNNSNLKFGIKMQGSNPYYTDIYTGHNISANAVRLGWMGTNGTTFNPTLTALRNGNILIATSTDNGIGKLQVNGKVTIATADSTSTPLNMLYQEPGTGEIKKAAVPSGTITGSGTSGRVAYWNNTSSLTSNANYLFGTPNGPSLSVGTTNTQGVLTLGGNKDLSSSGIQQYWAPATYTDQVTAASGTANSFTINYVGSPTIAAANTGVTFPEITTFTIEKPLAGINATLSKRTALRVNGLLNTTEAVQRSYSGAASNITLDNTYDIVAVSASGGNVTITLPAASGTNAGLTYTIKRTDNSGNTCTVAGTIDGATNYSLTAQYKYVTVTSNGTDWYIIANN